MEAAFQAMASLCAKREYCAYDIREKLFRRGLEQSEVQQILTRLEDEGYINEARYAKAFVHDKTLYDAWGFLKTKQALRAKGVAEHLIQEAIEAFPQQQYEDVLDRVVRNKQRSVKGKTAYETKQKLARSVIAKGFEPNKVFDRLNIQDEETEDEDF